MLLNEGCEVKAYDPIALNNAKKVLPSEVKFSKSVLEAIKGSQAAILTTEWEEFINFDWTSLNGIMSPPRLIIDGRNALSYPIILNSGLKYAGIGRCVK
jgi:UDPglucose 6-dehydrogenase